MCGVLCGAPFGLALTDTNSSSGRVSHFFGALKIDRFREPAGFRQDMDRMLQDLRECPAAEGAERVYFAGQKEMEHEEQVNRTGVPMLSKTYDQLCHIGTEYGVEVPDVAIV